MLVQHLEKIANFRVIVCQGSILGAARILGISQPALTKSLQILEQAVGERLLTRHSKGIELTEAGKTLFSYAEKLEGEVADIQVRIKTRAEVSGIVTIGSYETLGVSFWPKALKELRRSYPDLRVQISMGDSSALWRRLDDGILQLIVDAEPPLSEKYFSKTLYSDRFGLFANPSFKAPSGPLPVSYVRRAYDREGITIEEHLRRLKIENQLIYDFDTFVSSRAVAEESLAIAVLPLSLGSEDHKKLAPYKISGRVVHFGEHRLCVTCLENRRKDTRLEAVSKLLKSAALHFPG
jgi:DNA-binding transcriptional LysR family regulator